MAKRQRGKPIITLRLSASTIAALKMSANKHNTTVSDILRQLIYEQITKDGTRGTDKPIDGQITM